MEEAALAFPNSLRTMVMYSAVVGRSRGFSAQQAWASSLGQVGRKDRVSDLHL